MKTKIFLVVFFTLFWLKNTKAQIPNCDVTVPVFYIDFTAATSDSTWTSPSTLRSGNCCTSVPPDLCVLFTITTGANTAAIVFSFGNCPPPPGGIYYQVDCGSYTNWTDTTIITTPGVHYLTYCKPGNLSCTFSITSLVPQIPTGFNENESFSILTQDLSGNHFMTLDLTPSQSFRLSIFSVDGKKISEKNYSADAGQHKILLPTENLPQGIYFVQLKSTRNSVTKKLVVSR